ncbi:hypothetical protein FHX82_001766 [Amycolatopsis bartoniae]|uniref:Uncharacterized protein n=1 Tax=Amycolatopsis bartoniae TaxID=941986 RepID=A0A8H9M449_9PSEU|nr:hypothetical protein [Amycolatopsis bartoniae]MBB2934746.1 hypothetical protein [Amycolatopsis bartoniae]TVT01190.1 hypothetical protein FNH07_30010 [Amycolatopsis bartoniae]GHF45066.1 hypothetical protein GCM10017566_17600 [Amycolatopsis bartoniae]
MTGSDPHVHVERKVLEAGGAVRSAVTSLLGVVPESPSVVTTGCGIAVPLAMTSVRPESVTCLACREHARRVYLDFAGQVEHLTGMPGMTITAEQAAEAAQRCRDLADRFASRA